MNSKDRNGPSRLLGTWRLLGAVAVSAMMVSPAFAQLDAATSEEDRAVGEGAASQDRIDSIDDDTTDIVARYRTKIEELEGLRKYNQQIRELIADQEQTITSLQTQIEEASNLNRDILPFMDEMLLAIENFIALDAPFYEERRKADVQNVRSYMNQSDISVAEKFRQIMNLYTREVEYGSRISTYVGTVGEGDEAKQATFLQIGRAILVYQTDDESETAVWDKESESWQQLGGDYRANVRQAIRIADETAAPDIMVLPVPAAESAQ